MRSKKSLAVFAALMMLTVCIIPIAGYGNSSFEGAGSFIERPGSTDEVPSGSTAVYTVDDLKKIGTGANGTEWGLDAEYILMNDIEFTEEDNLTGGAEIEVTITVSGSGSSMKTTLTVKKDGTVVNNFSAWAYGNYGKDTTTGSLELTGNTVKNAFIEGSDFIIMVDASGAGTVTKNSNGNFEPIGSITTPFTGIFNGNGKVIRGMEVSQMEGAVFADVGMFAVIEAADTSKPTIKNLGIEGGYSAASSESTLSASGMITGWLKVGEISNCYATSGVYSSAPAVPSAVGEGTYAGGIAGVSEGTIKSSYNAGTVVAVGNSAYAGGITGFIGNVDTTNCYNAGTVSAVGEDDAAAGGIVGIIPAAVTDTFKMNRNLGNVRAEATDDAGKAYAGGIVGYSSTVISSSYTWYSSSQSTIVVEAVVGKGTAYAGGIVGYTEKGVTDSYLYTNSSGTKIKATATTGASGGEAWSGGIAGSAEYIYNSYNRSYSDTSSTNNVESASKDGTNKNNGRIVGLMPAGSELVNVYFRGPSSETSKLTGGDEDSDDAYSIDGLAPGADSTRLWGASGAMKEGDMLNNNNYFNGTTTLYSGSGSVNGWFTSGIWSMRSSTTSSNAPNNGYPFIDNMTPGVILILDRSSDITVIRDSEVVLEVTAHCELPLTYRWQQSSSGTGSWSNITDETSPILKVTPTSTMFYQCVISNGTSSMNETPGMKVTVLSETIDIRTASDLMKITNNMDGNYIQRADIDFTDVDLNGGVDLNLDIDIDNTDLYLRTTFVNGNNDFSASGLTVYFNGTFGITDSDGNVSFTGYDKTKDYKITVGGAVQAIEALVTFDLEKNAEDGRITKNSNGNMYPIGSFDKPFIGTYNGNGFKIIGLDVVDFSDSTIYGSAAGLFGVANTATIKNVTLENGSVSSLASNTSTEGYAYAGSILGFSIDSTIERCSSNLTVTAFGNSGDGQAIAGGIAGYTSNDIIISNSTGEVYGFSSDVSIIGGIAGINDGSITDSYSAGKADGVSSAVQIGGIAGESYGDVTNCYSRSTLGTTGNVGGIIGKAHDGNVTNCYFIGTASSPIAGDGQTNLLIDGGETRPAATKSGGKTESQLKDQATYFQGITDVGGEDVEGWNFSGDTWFMDGFPGLKAPVTEAEPSDDDGFDMKYVAIIVIAIIIVLLAIVLLRRRSA
jgi:hypothetical protein